MHFSRLRENTVCPSHLPPVNPRLRYRSFCIDQMCYRDNLHSIATSFIIILFPLFPVHFLLLTWQPSLEKADHQQANLTFPNYSDFFSQFRAKMSLHLRGKEIREHDHFVSLDVFSSFAATTRFQYSCVVLV